MTIAVAGTGYVGLVTGVILAHIGHDVTCVDVDKAKINLMKKGKSPIYEEGLEELMHANSERLSYTCDYKLAYKKADVIFIGVGTPERADGSANLDYVYSVCHDIINSVEKNAVVVIKSTVPIGTNEDIQELFDKNVSKNIKIDVVSNPEFLAQGTAVRDTLHASRIIIGTSDERAKNVMRGLYEPLTKKPYNVPYIEMSRLSAEMVKYASNNFLALKISYINEIANICEIIGADIEEVTNGMGYDQRIGNKFLNAGIGYGGSCFPKDTKALYFISKAKDAELSTIKACIDFNEKQKIRLIDKVKADFGTELKGKKIAILGVTFKPGTDDLREAPSILNTKILLDYGAHVSVYDPMGLDKFKKIFGNKVTYCKSINSCLNKKDMALIMTEWPQIKDFPLNEYEKLMKTPYLYDGRNCYNLKNVKKTNIIYKSIGR